MTFLSWGPATSMDPAANLLVATIKSNRFARLRSGVLAHLRGLQPPLSEKNRMFTPSTGEHTLRAIRPVAEDYPFG